MWDASSASTEECDSDSSWVLLKVEDACKEDGRGEDKVEMQVNRPILDLSCKFISAKYFF
jgi:hypothetical protein